MSLSKEDKSLYDRQIRVWGMEAQKRIQESRIVVVCPEEGLLLQETCKNLALCGIAELVLMTSKRREDRPALYSDLEGNLAEMNPRIACSRLEFSSEPTHNVLKSASIVMSINMDFLDLVKLDSTCAGLHIPHCALVATGTGHLFLFNNFGPKYDFLLKDGKETTLSFRDLATVQVERLFSAHRSELIKSFARVVDGDCRAGSADGAIEVASASILGALGCQEVIKLLSRKDSPIQNLLAIRIADLANSIGCV